MELSRETAPSESRSLVADNLCGVLLYHALCVSPFQIRFRLAATLVNVRFAQQIANFLLGRWYSLAIARSGSRPFEQVTTGLTVHSLSGILK